MNIVKRLHVLRKYMNKFELDIYLVPSTDAHNSEYVPECWARREWISGFDGSAGEAMITLEHGYLSTDGRYFQQALHQLDANYYTLMKQNGFAPETEQWLLENAAGKRVGVDPKLVGIERSQKLRQIMQMVGGELVILDDNLVDLSRLELGEGLSLPMSEAFYLDECYTGATIDQRLKWIRSELNQSQTDYIALNVLDEIAWLFNIRGSDIEYNPLVISYAIVGKYEVFLFVERNKIGTMLGDLLHKCGVQLIDYPEFGNYLAKLTGTVMLDDKTATDWMLNVAKQTAKVKLLRSPIVLAKAVKNAVEIGGTRKAHTHDAVSVINYLAWINNNWQYGVDEISAADKLAEFRAMHPSLKGSSFATISGFASNGAIIHYRATPSTNKIINDSSLYLVDSGGQYLEGTTDITRTIHLGTPTAIQKRHYTLVLKGHLALGRAVFPHGTCGEHLDVLARYPLWGDYLNYRHGTGHGVGSFLCVHEGPQRISPGVSSIPLVPGMIVSNEPGFYLDNEYGIRIENLCLVQSVQASHNSDYGQFYNFETLTLVPYCKNLIEVSLLSTEDKNQILSYYEQIRIKIRPKLDKNTQQWLDNEVNLPM